MGPRSPGTSCGLPGARTRRATARSCLALLPAGLAVPPLLPVGAVGSYPTLSPLPVRPEPPSAVCSLRRFPSPRDARALPGAVPCGARTFLERCDWRSSATSSSSAAEQSNDFDRPPLGRCEHEGVAGQRCGTTGCCEHKGLRDKRDKKGARPNLLIVSAVLNRLALDVCWLFSVVERCCRDGGGPETGGVAPST